MQRVEKPLRVAVVLCELPHYRRDVLTELDSKPELQIDWYADTNCRLRNIPSFSPELLSSFRRFRCVRFGRAWIQVGNYWQLLQSHDVYIFLGDASVATNWLLPRLAHRRGAKTFFWTMGWTRPDLGFKKRARAAFYGAADALLLYDERGAKIGRLNGLDPRRLAVIGNSVNYTPRPTTPDGPRKDIVVSTRLDAHKRIDTLLDVVSSSARLRGHRVVVVGAGQQESALREKSAQLGLDVQFVGAIYDAETLSAIYRNAAVACIPGPSGLSVVQAIAYGVPFVTVRDEERQMPEVAAITEDVSGNQVDSPAGLERALTTWLDRSARREGARQVFEDCRAVYDAGWTPQQHANRIAQIINPTQGNAGSL